MTLDVFVRFVLLPALGAAAVVAIIITLRQEWRDWVDGEW